MTGSRDSNGNRTGYEYNLRGDLTKIVNPDNSTVTFSRDYANNILSVTDELGNTTQHYYNLYGAEVKTVAGGVVLAERKYLFAGEVIEEKNDYATTTYAYDSWGRLVKKTTVSTGSSSASTQETEVYAYEVTAADSLAKTKKTVSNGTPGTDPIVTTEYRDRPTGCWPLQK